jgi:hypothetical protein
VGSTLADNKVMDLFADKGSEIQCDDFIHKTMADDEAITIGYSKSRYGVTVFWED